MEEYEAIVAGSFEVGKRLFKLGRCKKALHYFEEFLRVYPEDLQAWIWKGKTLMNLGRKVKAIRCFDYALVIDKKCIKAWILKAKTLGMLGQFKQEQECYEKAREIINGKKTSKH